MSSMLRKDVDAWLANAKALGGLTSAASDIDLEQEVEYQTDKERVKVVPCRQCKRPLVVTTFFAPAKALCGECKGETVANGGSRAVASIGQPTPGETDPAKAVDLEACLINRVEFAVMLCPFGHGEMELKNVSHNENYGPGHYEVTSKGARIWKQDAKGETVMHQCNECRCVVTLSTTAVQTFRRQNEPKEQQAQGNNGWAKGLGVREKREYVHPLLHEDPAPR